MDGTALGASVGGGSIVAMRRHWFCSLKQDEMCQAGHKSWANVRRARVSVAGPLGLWAKPLESPQPSSPLLESSPYLSGEHGMLGLCPPGIFKLLRA